MGEGLIRREDLHDNMLGNWDTIGQLSNPNLLINGGFQVWQRGNTFTNLGAGNYVADRWLVFNASGGNVIQQSNNAIRISPNSISPWHCNIAQILDNNDTLMMRGQTVTFSMNVSYANVAQMQILIADGGTLYASKPLVNGKNTLTVTLPNVAFNKLRIEIAFSAVTTDITNFLIIANCKLELGSIATPFSPRPYAEELELCKRYYQVQMMPCNVISTNNLAVESSFNVDMRTAPTVWLSNNSLFCHNNAQTTIFTVANFNRGWHYIQNLVSTDSNLVAGYNYSGTFIMDAEIY